MDKYKKALGLVVLAALMLGIFCANEADAGGRSSPPGTGVIPITPS